MSPAVVMSQWGHDYLEGSPACRTRVAIGPRRPAASSATHCLGERKRNADRSLRRGRATGPRWRSMQLFEGETTGFDTPRERS